MWSAIFSIFTLPHLGAGLIAVGFKEAATLVWLRKGSP
jgi:hypothetical protein